MMANSGNSPQPSQLSPLSISFKGAFSTHRHNKNVSLYNYVHDKLKHIKFLGIGTYGGSILPAVLSAVLVRVGGGGSTDVTYKVERHRSYDSLVGTALSGEDSDGSNRANIYYLEDASRIVLKDGSLDIFNTLFVKSGKEVLKDNGIFAGRADEVKDSSASVVYAVADRSPKLSDDAKALEFIAERINWLKSGNLVGLEDADKSVLDAIECLLKLAQIADIKLVEIMDGSVEVINVRSASISELRHMAERMLYSANDETALLNSLIYGREGNSVGQVSDLVQAIGQVELRGLVQEIAGYVKHNVKFDVEELLGVQRHRNKLASELADTIVANKVGRGVEIRADDSAVRFIIKSASILDASMNIVEKVAGQVLIETLERYGVAVNPRAAELVHYILMERDTDYKKSIEGLISKFVEGFGVKSGDILDTYRTLSEKVIEQFTDSVELTEAYKIALGEEVSLLSVQEAVNTTIGMLEDSLSAQRLFTDIGTVDKDVNVIAHGVAGESVIDNTDKSIAHKVASNVSADSLNISVRPLDDKQSMADDPNSGLAIKLDRKAAQEIYTLADKQGVGNYARIEFEHELNSAESVAYKALLDNMYSDFSKLDEDRRMLDQMLEPLQAYKYDKESLINNVLVSAEHIEEKRAIHVDDLVAGDQSLVPDRAEIMEGNLLFNEVSSRRIGDLSELVIAKLSKDYIGQIDDDIKAEGDKGYSGFVTEGLHFDWSDDSYQESNILTEPDFWGEMVDRDFPLVPYGNEEEYILGEITDKDDEITVLRDHEEILAELISDDKDETAALMLDEGLWAEVMADRGDDNYVPPEEEVLAKAVDLRVVKEVTDDHEIAVLSCSPPDWSFRERPPLPPDPKIPEPVFEHVCDKYVCEDWLHFPLIDFTGAVDDMYDENCKPRFPTGEYDQNGNPYILPPYTILNEPVGNGEVVGGRQMMAINPCNLYDVIHYIVKVYDAYKVRFSGSSPVDSMSRVLNMTFNEIKKLVDEWDGTQQYTPDEMWRIYRFIRWIAIGVTNRFYKVKLVYEWGDFIETFENPPPSDWISYNGAIIRNVTGYSKVLDGRPMLESQQNTAEINFKVPVVAGSSVISFDMGNAVPDRPARSESNVFVDENFEDDPSQFKISGTGWVKAARQGGNALVVQDPASRGIYRTTSFTVPSNATTATVTFNYGIDSNMEGAYLALVSDSGAEVWKSNGFTPWGSASVNLTAGGYHFETNVPQAEGNSLVPLTFTTQRINNEWQKVGHQTQWVVNGETIYEDENTPALAMVINTQWLADRDYIFEGEFMTSGGPTGMEDWIGFIFNYKGANQYYAVGSYGETSPGINAGNYSGVWKSQLPYENVPPTWRFTTGDLKWRYNVWYKVRIEVSNGNTFKIFINGNKVLEITDPNGWGGGASGLAAYSNPQSTFRNVKYYSKPMFDAFIDNVKAIGTLAVPVDKPEYMIDFYLDDTTTPVIADYSTNAKSTFSFPIMSGEHKAKWVFKKRGSQPSIDSDASFIDNILIKNVKIVGCHTEEEFIGCGGHFAVKWLIDNLLEYYRRHHEACKGRRDIWIIE